MFDFEKLTKIGQNVLIEAQNLVKINKNSFLEPAHIFLAILNSSNNESVNEFLGRLKLGGNLVRSDVQNLIETYPKISDSTVQLYFSNNSLKLMDTAFDLAKTMKDKFVSYEHIVLALSKFVQEDKNEEGLKKIFNKFNITELNVLNAIKNLRGDKTVNSENADEEYKVMEKKLESGGIGLKIPCHKAILAMKLTCFLMCCLLFNVQAAVKAQGQTVSLKLEQVSVAEAIRQLKEQTQLDFFFSNKQVDVDRKVSLDLQDIRLDEALKMLKFERRVELAMESDRFFDLVRWGEAATVLNQYYANEADNCSIYSSASFTADKNEYLPIPFAQVSASNGHYTQNIGGW